MKEKSSDSFLCEICNKGIWLDLILCERDSSFTGFFEMDRTTLIWFDLFGEFITRVFKTWSCVNKRSTTRVEDLILQILTWTPPQGSLRNLILWEREIHYKGWRPDLANFNLIGIHHKSLRETWSCGNGRFVAMVEDLILHERELDLRRLCRVGSKDFDLIFSLLQGSLKLLLVRTRTIFH